MSAAESTLEPLIPSDDEDDAENIEIDLENSIWEFDPCYELDAPQWVDFTNIDDVWQDAEKLGGDHSWFMKPRFGHERPRAASVPSHSIPEGLSDVPSSPKTPNGKSRLGPLGISHLGSPMRVMATSAVAASPPRAAKGSPRAAPTTPTLSPSKLSSPMRQPPVSSRLQSLVQSPKAAVASPVRSALGSPSRVSPATSIISATPSTPDKTALPILPGSQDGGKARSMMRSFSVTLKSVIAAKEAAKTGSPTPAVSMPPPQPVVASPQILTSPVPSIATPKLATPASPSETLDELDSFPSPPPVTSSLLGTLLQQYQSPTVVSTTTSSSSSSALVAAKESPVTVPAAAAPIAATVPSGSLLGKLGAPMRVVAPVEPPVSAADEDLDDVDPLDEIADILAQAAQLGTKPTSTTPPVTVVPQKGPAKSIGATLSRAAPKPTVAAAKAAAKPPVRSAAPVETKKPVPASSAAISKPKPAAAPAATGQAARRWLPGSGVAPAPPKQPSTITKRKARVVFTPASSGAMLDENFENPNDAWEAAPPPTQKATASSTLAARRSTTKPNVEIDEGLMQMLREHNKKFQPKPAYEPRKFSLKEIRDWERQSGQQWYALSPQSREKANQEIAFMKQSAAQN